MNICHLTNTFLPHVGGVARSVETLMIDQRRRGHRVLVVAPTFAEGKARPMIERSVVRIPALTHFQDSDFSVRLPFAASFDRRLQRFSPDIIHCHHPFLLGDTGLRLAASKGVPVVFTHHTLYENYVHHVADESAFASDLASDLASRFANRCQAVIAPSESVRDTIASRGVTVPIYVQPTGVDVAFLAQGQAERFLTQHSLSGHEVIIGHVGRFAAEKNLSFLAEALIATLKKSRRAKCVWVGDGPERADLESAFASAGLASRALFTGTLQEEALADAYAAMDVFAFASQSETQGLVLAEVMASATAPVALDGPGVRDVVHDGVNGILLPADATPAAMANALAALVTDGRRRKRLGTKAAKMARDLDRNHTCEAVLSCYQEVLIRWKNEHPDTSSAKHVWQRILTEGQLLADKAGALFGALAGSPQPEPSK